MADYIFTSGTVLKKDLYSFMKSQLINAGWSNVSSNPNTDFDVFKSIGEDGTKNLVFQMRPYSATAANSIETSDNNIMAVRLPGGYTPGVGTAGVYTLTIATTTIVFDGVTFTYAATPVAGTSWNNATALIPLLQANATIGAKYTFDFLTNTTIRVTQKPYYESPTAPTVTGTGSSIATNTAGVSSAGTFARPSDTWRDLYVLGAAAAQPKDSTTISYKIHVNKNRIIMMLESPDALALGPVVFYLGLPDETYCTDGASKGVVFGTTCSATTANAVIITDAPDEAAALTASATRTVYGTLAPKNPNAAGKYSLTEMTYGSTTEGERGKLTGIYCMPNQNILNKDILVIGTKQYYVGVCQSLGSTSFLSNVILVQIS